MLFDIVIPLGPNEIFYGTQIVTGAGIGRKDTNPLLIKLMKDLHP